MVPGEKYDNPEVRSGLSSNKQKVQRSGGAEPPPRTASPISGPSSLAERTSGLQPYVGRLRLGERAASTDETSCPTTGTVEDAVVRIMSKAMRLFVGLALAAVAWGACRLGGLPEEAAGTGALAMLCAFYWVSQPVPIPVTSLIPFAVLPLLGVLDHKQVAHSYGHTLVLLLLAGFILSTAIEACGAHRRLALGMARLVSGPRGATPRRLLLGFMIASAVMSMWISNTATVLILLPVVLATTEGPERRALRERLLIGVAYAGSIGGVGTPIGTPPNLLFMANYAELGKATWAFSDWMLIGVPVILLMVPAAFFVLGYGLPDRVLPPLAQVGPMTTRERRVLVIFGLTALGWITRVEPFGGWSGTLGMEGAGDSTVAFVGLVLMFFLPDGEGGRLLSWEEAERIPWGILLLFGGGLALAAGFAESGLSASMGRALTVLTRAPEPIMILGTCLTVTFLTEVTSNTATTALLMPVLGATAQAAGLEPARLMVPAALSASCAFMLPVATAPNAIIFGSGEVRAAYMARQGVFLNLIGAVVITVITLTLL